MSTASWIVPGPQQLDLSGVTALRLQLIGGRAEVVAGAGPETRVEVRSVVGRPLEVRQDGATLSIGYPFLGWDGWLKRLNSFRAKDAAEVRVVVPATTGVRAGTVGADVDLVGIGEDVSVATAGGAARVRGGWGSADLKSVSGALDVVGRAGAVRATSVSGPVTLDGALPRVEVSSVSGAVEVATSLASSVVNLTTVSAGAGVALPAGGGLVLTARTVSGRVLVDELDRRVSGVTTVEERSDENACWLTATTVSGTVRVRRRPGPAAEGAPDSAPQD